MVRRLVAAQQNSYRAHSCIYSHLVNLMFRVKFVCSEHGRIRLNIYTAHNRFDILIVARLRVKR